MYERFDNKAIESVLLAQEQARQLGQASVDTEHLLLGLVAARGGVAFEALESFGVTLPLLQTKIGKDVDSKAISSSKSLELPLTERSQAVVALAWASAQALQQASIGTHNLLAGLIDEPSGHGANLLAQFGINPNELREQSIAFANQIMQADPAQPRWARGWEAVNFEPIRGILLLVIEELLNARELDIQYSRSLAALLGQNLRASRLLIVTRQNGHGGLKSREWRASNVLLSCRQLQWPGENSAILKMFLAARKPVLIPEDGPEPSDSNIQSEMHLLGAQSLLGIPLHHEEISYGCLILQPCDYRKKFDSGYLRWLQELSDLFGAYLAKHGDDDAEGRGNA